MTAKLTMASEGSFPDNVMQIEEDDDSNIPCVTQTTQDDVGFIAGVTRTSPDDVGIIASTTQTLPDDVTFSPSVTETASDDVAIIQSVKQTPPNDVSISPSMTQTAQNDVSIISSVAQMAQDDISMNSDGFSEISDSAYINLQSFSNADNNIDSSQENRLSSSGFSNISDGEYSCRLYALDEDMDIRLTRIQNESYSSSLSVSSVNDSDLDSHFLLSSSEHDEIEFDTNSWHSPTPMHDGALCKLSVGYDPMVQSIDPINHSAISDAIIAEETTICNSNSQSVPANDTKARNYVSEPVPVNDTMTRNDLSKPVPVNETMTRNDVSEPVPVNDTMTRNDVHVSEPVPVNETMTRNDVSEPVPVNETMTRNYVSEPVPVNETMTRNDVSEPVPVNETMTRNDVSEPVPVNETMTRNDVSEPVPVNETMTRHDVSEPVPVNETIEPVPVNDTMTPNDVSEPIPANDIMTSNDVSEPVPANDIMTRNDVSEPVPANETMTRNDVSEPVPVNETMTRNYFSEPDPVNDTKAHNVVSESVLVNDTMTRKDVSEPFPANVPAADPDVFNESFVAMVVQHGLLNETEIDISFDLLDGSESEDDMPLSKYRKRSSIETSVSTPLKPIDMNIMSTTHENQENIRYTGINSNHVSPVPQEPTANTVESEHDELSPVEKIPSSDNHMLSRRGRKRTRNELSWKRNVTKEKRNTGKAYLSRTNKEKRARILGRGCGHACRYKCHDRINENQREQIFHEFWCLGDVNRQRDQLSNWVQSKPKKVSTLAGPNSNTSPRRKNTKTWQFKIDGSYVRVCKKFLLDTLDISQQMVDTALEKAKNENSVSGIVPEDRRGKHNNRANKVPEDRINQVKDHINSFPRVESHYCRKDTFKHYLEPGLSVPKMYTLYQSHCEVNNFEAVSIYTYRHIFDTHFNIGFHSPTKDRCDLCARFENRSEAERLDMQTEYDNHIKNKRMARDMKDEDKMKAKNDPDCAAACFDLQQILVTPKSNESVLYYSRKLCSFNLTVYDLGTKEGFCYIWNEAISGRGACEIASCVYKYMYLENQAELGRKEISLFSDNCGGQNRNRFFVSMLCYAKQKFGFIRLEHKFLERGHTQNENDSIHAAIELSSRGKSIYTTPQWAATVRNARQANPYNVAELDSDDFFDFKCLSQAIPNIEFDVNTQKIRWMKIKTVSFDEKNYEIMNLRYNDFTSARVNLGVKRSSTRSARSQQQNSTGINFPPLKKLYCDSEPPKVALAKYKALTQLCTSNIIPKVHHNFFYSLPHKSEADSDSD